jgi:hypothetical protein
MGRRWIWTTLLCAPVIAVIGALTLNHDGVPLETVTLTRPPVSAPALCPWRSPPRDMRALFPAATAYRTETLILSRLRAQIIRQLGPETPLESNALHVYRIMRGSRLLGSVLVRRTAAKHGALEVVVGVDAAGCIVGVRIQRQREPPPVARTLTSPRWLASFRGKTDNSDFRPGGGIPGVPPAARLSAEKVAGAVRALLIEFRAGETTIASAHSHG